MAIPVYLWLKDDGGADIKGSVDVQDREGSIEVVASIALSSALPNNDAISIDDTETTTPAREITAISDVPAPISTIRLPNGFVMLSQAWFASLRTRVSHSRML